MDLSVQIQQKKIGGNKGKAKKESKGRKGESKGTGLLLHIVGHLFLQQDYALYMCRVLTVENIELFNGSLCPIIFSSLSVINVPFVASNITY